MSWSLAGFINNYDDLRSAEPGPPPFNLPITFANGVEGETYIEVTAARWNQAVDAYLDHPDEMNLVADADEYYQLMLNKTAYRTDGSGLGLARIRAEAEMSITYEVMNEHLHIKAIAPLTPAELQ